MKDVVARCLCRVYRTLLYAYPPAFRRRFGNEMAQSFADRCQAVLTARGITGLFALTARTGLDWCATTIYEGIDSMRSPTPSSYAFNHAVPVFYTCGSDAPRPGALVNGGVLSIAVFAFISFLVGHGGTHPVWLIGSHHPSRSHLFSAATMAEAKGELGTEIKVKPQPDEPPVSPYFKVMLVLTALDTDHDGIISAAEIANAPAALRRLDKDGDGRLSPEECGLDLAGSPADQAGTPDVAKHIRLGFMRLHPVLAALDTDHDGEISAREINLAARSLRTLDQNGDRQLTIEELWPDPVIAQVNGLLLALDKDGDGTISRDERATALGGKFRAILDSADSNHDGAVTEAELTNEMRRRADVEQR